MKILIKISLVILLSFGILIILNVLYTNYLKQVPKEINNQIGVYLKKDYSKKPTILIIFSPQCGPCQVLIQNVYENRESLISANLLLASTRDSLLTNSFFLSISRLWVKEMQFSNSIYESRGKIPSYFVETGLPKVYIFDKSGDLKYIRTGPSNLDSIKLMLKNYE